LTKPLHAFIRGSVPPPIINAMPPKRRGQYTIDEVEAHNTARSLWIVMNRKVYDITVFHKRHPGGPAVLLQMGGKDATAAATAAHSSILPGNLMWEFCIGSIVRNKKVVDEEPDKVVPVVAPAAVKPEPAKVSPTAPAKVAAASSEAKAADIVGMYHYGKGVYEIREIDGKLFFVEGDRQGALVADGEHLVATLLTPDKKSWGTIRLRYQAGTITSHFKKPGKILYGEKLVATKQVKSETKSKASAKSKPAQKTPREPSEKGERISSSSGSNQGSSRHGSSDHHEEDVDSFDTKMSEAELVSAMDLLYERMLEDPRLSKWSQKSGKPQLLYEVRCFITTAVEGSDLFNSLRTLSPLRRSKSNNSLKRAGSSDIKELKNRLESVFDDLVDFLLGAMLKPCSLGEDTLISAMGALSKEPWGDPRLVQIMGRLRGDGKSPSAYDSHDRSASPRRLVGLPRWELKTSVTPPRTPTRGEEQDPDVPFLQLPPGGRAVSPHDEDDEHLRRFICCPARGWQ